MAVLEDVVEVAPAYFVAVVVAAEVVDYLAAGGGDAVELVFLAVWDAEEEFVVDHLDDAAAGGGVVELVPLVAADEEFALEHVVGLVQSGLDDELQHTQG